VSLVRVGRGLPCSFSVSSSPASPHARASDVWDGTLSPQHGVSAVAPGRWAQEAVAEALEDVARILRRRPPGRVGGYVRPAVVRDEIIRQAIVNEAKRLYGQREMA